MNGVFSQSAKNGLVFRAVLHIASSTAGTFQLTQPWKTMPGRTVLSFAAAGMKYVITLLGGSATNLGQGHLQRPSLIPPPHCDCTPVTSSTIGPHPVSAYCCLLRLRLCLGLGVTCRLINDGKDGPRFEDFCPI